MEYWFKQDISNPLYPDLLWSRPEQATSRGKLLIIGGNQFGFSAPGEAFGVAKQAGIGSSRVILPQIVKKVAGVLFPNIEFAPNNPSGGFAKSALDNFLAHAEWADGVLLAGDLGHNSETAILIESFLDKYKGQVTLTKDAVSYCLTTPKIVIDRPNTLLVLSMAELQKIALNTHFDKSFRLGMDLIQLVQGLNEFTKLHKLCIIVKHQDQIAVAVNGLVSTTQLTVDLPLWQVQTATHATVWWLQNPTKQFEALTTAITSI